MTEMIERVARAICSKCNGDPDARVEAARCWNWEQYKDAARAAIREIDKAPKRHKTKRASG